MSNELEHEIVVVVEGGCVIDVRGLPDNWGYAIEDYDVGDDLTPVTTATQGGRGPPAPP